MKKLILLLIFFLFSPIINIVGQEYTIKLISWDSKTKITKINFVIASNGLHIDSTKIDLSKSAKIEYDPKIFKKVKFADEVNSKSKGINFNKDMLIISADEGVKKGFFTIIFDLDSVQNIEEKIKIGGDNVKVSSNKDIESKSEKIVNQFIFDEDPTGTSACIECGDNKESQNILYDLQCQKFIFPKKEMLKIGSLVNIIPTNYNPFVDSISVSVNFSDKNLENQQQFAQIFTAKSSDATSPSKTDSTKSKGVGAQGSGSDNKTTNKDSINIHNLSIELDKYYKRLLSSTNVNIDKLEKTIEKLFANINTTFNISVTNIEDFQKAIKNTKDFKDRDATVNEIVKLIKKIQSYRRFAFPPIQIQNADLTEFNFEVFKNKNKIFTPKYYFFNKGGFKIDFSSGIFASGLVNDVFSTKSFQTFDTTRVYKVVYDRNGVASRKDSITGFSNVTKQKIIQGNSGEFNIGLGVLLHAYSRWWKRINLGASVGGIIDNQSKVRYLAGGSLLLGREQRLIFTYGCAFGQIAKLADGSNIGDVITSSNVPTKDVWDRGWFFSVTYNLGNIVK